MRDDLKECLDILKDYNATPTAPWDLDNEQWGVDVGEEAESGVCCTEDGKYGAFWNNGESYEYFDEVAQACNWLIYKLCQTK